MKTLIFGMLLSAATLGAQVYLQPELSSGYLKTDASYGTEMMVASANPMATEAGFQILKQGGTAIDAAIVVQMMLNVVEPQSSGIGGGAFLLYYDKINNQVTVYDGRETAPQGIDPNQFLDANGEPMPIHEAIVGGMSVGVPGLLRMLEEAHRDHGKKKWIELFAPAAIMAENGFPISARLAHHIARTPHLATFETTRNLLFMEDGKVPKSGGMVLKNSELAETFRDIGQHGASVFYRGELAKKIVETVQNAPYHPGSLSLEDMKDYKVIKREPLATPYRHFNVYGAPPPAGGVTVAQILGMVEHFPLREMSIGSMDFIKLFCEASQLAYADRSLYVADPAFFPVPTARLLNHEYLTSRAEMIGTKKMQHVFPGTWPGLSKQCCPPLIESRGGKLPSTSQICVVDVEGNVVSMTTSIEYAFGSTLMVGGFFLNNQLTDFSFVPEEDGAIAANRIQPGKRPLSAMSPTIVFDGRNNNFVLSVGSAGGARIIDYVAKTLFGVLDFGLNIHQAIGFPNYAVAGSTIDLERGTFLDKYQIPLEDEGLSVNIIPLTSGTQGIQDFEGILIGAADPRREGMAMGE